MIKETINPPIHLSNHVVLIPSTMCQLRCRYCYADSVTRGEFMSMETASTAINFVVKNSAIRRGLRNGNSIFITFHGGGEPCLNFKLLKGITLYAQNKCDEYGLVPIYNLFTNGYIKDDNQIAWLIENINNIQVSLDGLEKENDFQRPFHKGNGTYQTIITFINKLDRAEKKYSIHTTVTDYNVDGLADFSSFIAKNYHRCSKLVLSPLHPGGRATEGELQSPLSQKYLNAYSLVKNNLAESHTEVYVPCERAFRTGISCVCDAAAMSSLTVAPDGTLTLCHESISNPDMSIGKIANGRVDFDYAKIRNLQTMVENNSTNPECLSCKVHHICAGGCLLNKNSQYCSLMNALFDLRNDSSKVVTEC